MKIVLVIVAVVLATLGVASHKKVTSWLRSAPVVAQVSWLAVGGFAVYASGNRWRYGRIASFDRSGRVRLNMGGYHVRRKLHLLRNPEVLRVVSELIPAPATS